MCIMNGYACMCMHENFACHLIKNDKCFACKVQLVVNTREHTPLSLEASTEHVHDA